MLLQRHVLHSYTLGGGVERPFMTYDVMVYDIHIVSNITDCPVNLVLLYHFDILVKDPYFFLQNLHGRWVLVPQFDIFNECLIAFYRIRPISETLRWTI